MGAVRGSKQYQMVVVRHRPAIRIIAWVLLVLLFGALIYLSYVAGEERGLALRTEVVDERDLLREQLQARERLNQRLRQQLADVQVGKEIDDIANEEVRVTIENLQQTIADLSEEIRFYKSVMLPGAREKGLRIERLALKEAGDFGRYGYNLLLVQVVDKHDYVQGSVEMDLLGEVDGMASTIPFRELANFEGDKAGFRFRYFQNFEAEFAVPNGFEPTEILVKVTQSGGKKGRIERRFSWQITE